MSLSDPKLPKTKDELEKQISDNLELSKGQVAKAVTGGALGGIMDGAAATYILAMGSKFREAWNAATSTRSAQAGSLVGKQTVTDTGLFAAKLAEGPVGSWEITKSYMKNNKAVMGIVAAATVGMGYLYTRSIMKGMRKESDAKIGEAYRHYKTQYAGEPLMTASSEKPIVGEHTQKLAAEAKSAEHAR